MPISSLAIVALTPGELVLEYVDVAILGPSWPWGSSPGLEISEGLELASEFVDLVSEGVDADFEVGARENFTRFVSPPHLEDPLLVFIFDTSSAVDTFIFSSGLISPASTRWDAGAPRKGLSSM